MRSCTVAQIAEWTGAEVCGALDRVITGADSLQEAHEGCVSFLGSMRYSNRARQSHAGAIFLRPAERELPLREGVVRLVVEDPSVAFQRVVVHFADTAHRVSGFAGIHPTAVVHPSACLGEGVTVLPYAVIDAHVVLERDVWVGPHVSIGPGSYVGARSVVHAHAVLREGVVLGAEVVVQPGAVLGSCGYGYHTDPATGQHTKQEQLGGVRIGDRVEIGANTTIDRGRFRDTEVGEGTKVDNLVQVAHNVVLGKDNLVVAQVGLAGSSRTGARCVLGGQAALVGHVQLGDGVIVTARGAVTKDIPKEGAYAGAPARPYREEMRHHALLRRLLARALSGEAEQLESEKG